MDVDDPGLAARFARDGFLLVENVLAPEEVADFGARVDAAVRTRTLDAAPLAERSAYQQSFLQCINLWEDHPEIRGLSFHPRICSLAAALLDAPRIRLWHDQALYKEAGGRGTDPHQDLPYWPMAETDALTAWIPFQHVREENGATGFLPGSHRLGLRRFVNIFAGEPEDCLASPELQGLEPVYVEAPPGAVVFHHGLTVHLARPNRSGTTRRVHTAIYFRDGVTRSRVGIHPCVDRYETAPGAAICSDATPVAWPRAGGQEPEPPDRPVPENALGRALWP